MLRRKIRRMKRREISRRGRRINISRRRQSETRKRKDKNNLLLVCVLALFLSS
jgi:hypothetical protein